MDLVLAIFSIIFISALAVDWLLMDQGLTKQLANIRDNYRDSNESRHKPNVISSSKLFCDIFDAVYGKQTWSWKRFYRSTILSCLFIIFSIVIIGINKTFIQYLDIATYELIIACLIVIPMNIVIDFFSLQETRLVLKIVNRRMDRKLSFIVVWVVLDLAFTSLIYFFLMGIVVVGALLISEIITSILNVDMQVLILAVGGFFELLTDKEMLLPFYMSTFGTSIVWYIFVALTFLTKYLSKFTQFALVTKAISETTSPARVVAVIFTVPLAFVLILFHFIGKAL